MGHLSIGSYENLDTGFFLNEGEFNEQTKNCASTNAPSFDIRSVRDYRCSDTFTFLREEEGGCTKFRCDKTRFYMNQRTGGELSDIILEGHRSWCNGRVFES